MGSFREMFYKWLWCVVGWYLILQVIDEYSIVGLKTPCNSLGFPKQPTQFLYITGSSVKIAEDLNIRLIDCRDDMQSSSGPQVFTL